MTFHDGFIKLEIACQSSEHPNRTRDITPRIMQEWPPTPPPGATSGPGTPTENRDPSGGLPNRRRFSVVKP
jgi:hypothetical protein